MKLKSILVIILMIISEISYCKDLIVGSHDMELSFGMVNNFKPYSISFGYSHILRPRFKIGGQLNFTNWANDDVYKIPVVDLTGGLTLSHIIAGSKRRSTSLWGEGEIFAGYESINYGDKTLPDGAVIKSEGGFVYGVAVALKLEIELSRKTALLISFKERYLPSGQAYRFNSIVSVGITIGLK